MEISIWIGYRIEDVGILQSLKMSYSLRIFIVDNVLRSFPLRDRWKVWQEYSQHQFLTWAED